MVKTEWRAIKAERADKAYTEIDDPSGTSSTAICTSWPMVSMVWCWCTALTRPASTPRSTTRTPMGKPLWRCGWSFQAAAKLLAVLQIHEPGDQTVEPKRMYCQRLNETEGCGGTYQ